MASTTVGCGASESAVTAKGVLATAASIAATAMLARTMVNEYVPYELRDLISAGIASLRGRFYGDFTIVVGENSEGHTRNEIFHDALTYLGTMAHNSVRRLRVSKRDGEEVDKGIVVSIDHGEQITDVFIGVEFKWQLICTNNDNNSGGRGGNDGRSNWSMESRSLELTFNKKHKDLALNSYLPHVLEHARRIKEGKKTLKIHMNYYDNWTHVNLHHPATFETLAMDDDLKSLVMEDLARFVKRKEYYNRIGKAWKRGYLLYGPPGTGKSSLVAAMANFLKFDIYDIELTEVRSNTELRNLIINSTNQSIIVVEDIDCSIELKNRESSDDGGDGGDDNKVTLSGLLNCIDGLWSSCGEERIIVFTTNYKDRLDPALLRPGRMDMHVYMGYCGASAFKILARNYHGVVADEHPMFVEVEELLRRVEATPAEVAEELMRSDDVDAVFRGLVKFLEEKKKRKVAAADEAVSNEGNSECVDEEVLVIDSKEEM